MELHLTNLVPDQIIRALCDTLIHSLWQGIILAVVTGITILLTKRSAAALRYNLMIGYLLLFSVAVVFTFYKQLPAVNHPAAVTKIVNTSPTPPVYAINYQPRVIEKPAGLVVTSIGYFNNHAETIVLIWFFIICARCVQFAAGLQGVYYLKRTKVTPAGEFWGNRLTTLADKMAIKRTVKLLESGMAKLPMVIGHFKPVILIPIGFLTALSTEEVEAILIHELAHIRRKDYLVNLLQNMVEILFFFNPAILWVSALIKAERENCCDDMVVAQTSNKANYIKALVSCEEYRSATPSYAMGLGGKEGHFLQRVKRILSNNNQTLNRVEKMVLTICLISAVLITAAFSKAEKKPISIGHKAKNGLSAINKAIATIAPINLASPVNTVEPAVLKTNKSIDTSAKARNKNTGVNGDDVAKELLKEDIVQDKNNFTFKIDNDELVIDGVKQSDDIYRRIVEKFVRPGDEGKFSATYTYHNVNNNESTTSESSGVSGNGSASAYGSNSASSSGNGAQAHSQSGSGASVSYGNGASAAYGTNGSSSYGRASNGTGSVSYGAGDFSYGNNGDHNEAFQRRLQEKNMEIGDELVRENLVKNKYSYTYKLSPTELYVDGVKQPDRIHRELMEKYFKPGENSKITFNYVNSDSTKSYQRYDSNSYHYRDLERRAAEKAALDEIVNDMIKDGIITNQHNLTFKLSDTEFIVNGKTQDEAAFNRYKQKYVPAENNKNWTWTHTENRDITNNGNNQR